MDTNARARAVVDQLIESGTDETVIARRLGVSLPWLRRWLAGDGVIDVGALDALGALLQEHHAARRARLRLVSSRW